jgi:hypothetical protein
MAAPERRMRLGPDEGQPPPVLAERDQDGAEQVCRARVRARHARQVDDRRLQLWYGGRHTPHRRLDRREAEVALEAEHADPAGRRVEQRALARAAETLRADVGQRQVRADARPRDARHAQEVQVQVAREPTTDGDAARAVALRVERRREDADAELARQHRQDAAADAALRRHADVVDPRPGGVVHAARRHDAEDVLDVLPLDGAIVGPRVHAAARERRRHEREVAAVDRDRALTEVEVERHVRILGQHVEVPQQVGDRAVAVPGRLLRAIDRVVDRERRPA